MGAYSKGGVEMRVKFVLFSSRVTFRRLIFILATGLLLSGCGGNENEGKTTRSREVVDPPAIATELQEKMEIWLAGHGSSPTDYVLGLFAEHDVVILGEQHRLRHDPLFIQQLIPLLPAAGVQVMAMEFALREDQALMDSLVTAPEWDEKQGRGIFFRMFMPWGFREYVDVLKVAWQVNRDRPTGAPSIRVLGVGNSVDFSLYKSEANWNDPEVQKAANAGQTEADWAGPVLAEVERGKKVLVYCGIHHAFTKFRQPIVRDGVFAGYGVVRFGNHLREELGERVTTIYLHALWNSSDGYGSAQVHPADGRLDAFMLARNGGPFAVGFDVAGSPLAGLPIENAVYKHGHEPFTMAKFCDGWVYTKPVGRYEPVTYIEDWINDDNIERARASAMNPRWRNYSVEKMTKGCKSYLDDFIRFYGGLR